MRLLISKLSSDQLSDIKRALWSEFDTRNVCINETDEGIVIDCWDLYWLEEYVDKRLVFVLEGVISGPIDYYLTRLPETKGYIPEFDVSGLPWDKTLVHVQYEKTFKDHPVLNVVTDYLKRKVLRISKWNNDYFIDSNVDVNRGTAFDATITLGGCLPKDTLISLHKQYG